MSHPRHVFRARTALVVALCLPACATDGSGETELRSAESDKLHHHIEQIFQARDADQSGGLSRAEARGNPWVSHNFDRADVDQSGEVSPEELTQLALDAHEGQCEDCSGESALEAHIDEAFPKLDADGDGFVTPAEAQGQPLEGMFAAADGDGDGKVTRDELLHYVKTAHAAHMNGAHQ